jgi:hypothetical protein
MVRLTSLLLGLPTPLYSSVKFGIYATTLTLNASVVERYFHETGEQVFRAYQEEDGLSRVQLCRQSSSEAQFSDG